MSIYGLCSECGCDLSPVWFEDVEKDSHNIPTGRARRAVDYLVCDFCGHKECVDDSFDGPWYYRSSKPSKVYRW